MRDLSALANGSNINRASGVGGSRTEETAMQLRSLYVESFQVIFNHWRMVLSPVECEVLLFINERTTRYHKEEERIPLRHFLEGVIMRSGEIVIAGLNRGKASIIKAYQSLRDRGLIRVREGKSAREPNAFRIDFDKLIKGAYEMAGKLKISKKYRNNEDGTKNLNRSPTEPHKESVRVTGRTAISTDRDKTDKSREKQPRRAARVGTGRKLQQLQTAIDSAVTKSRDKRREKAAASTAKPTYTNIIALWKDKLVEHNDQAIIPNVNRRTFGIFKANYSANILPIPLPDFMAWVIENWRDIRAHELSWVDDLPVAPDFLAFSRFFSYFARSYAQVDERRRVNEDKLKRRSTRDHKLLQEAERREQEADKLRRELEEEKRKSQHYQRIAQEKPANRPRRRTEECKPHGELDFVNIKLPE